jgi:hypothetical protein
MKVGVFMRVLMYVLAPGRVQMNMLAGLQMSNRDFGSRRASAV